MVEAWSYAGPYTIEANGTSGDPVTPPSPSRVGGSRVCEFPTRDTSRLRKKLVKGTNLAATRRRRIRAGRLDGALAAVGRWSRLPLVVTASYRLLREVSDAHQVVDRQAEDEHPADAPSPAVPRLPHQADRFQPAEDLFDPLALLLAHLVAGVARGTGIDRTRPVRGVLRHMRGHLEQAQRSDKVATVVAFVGAQGDPSGLRHGADHRQRGGALAVASGRREAAVDRQAVAVLHQNVTLITELGFPPLALAVEPRLRVRGRGVGHVATPLTMEVHRRVARIVRGRRGRVLALE